MIGMLHLMIGTTNKKVYVVTKIININRNPKHSLMFPLQHFPVVTYFILLISSPCLSREMEYQGYKSIYHLVPMFGELTIRKLAIQLLV